MPKFIHGFHDGGGEHLHADRPGWTLITEEIGHNPGVASGRNYTDLSSRGFSVVVRLNNGYGNQTGTIPLPTQFTEYAATCAAWVAKSKGANIWVISNEINHEAERPNGVFISPEEYAGLFTLTRNAIKRSVLQAQVIPAPLAPYHANPLNWLDYLRRMLKVIEYQGGCDGIAIHAYTRSAKPADILSNAKMGPPLQDQYSGFRTYQDALGVVPMSMHHLPAYILEFNEYEAWVDSNTGVVKAAYEEINRWNLLPGVQRIHALLLYRWPDFDRWGIINKPGVQADFREAVQKGYKVPEIEHFNRPTAIVNASGGANIRIGAGLSYKVLGIVEAETELTIVGRNMDSSWWQVLSSFGKGWVSATVVETVNTQTVPVVLITVPATQPPVTAPTADNWQRTIAWILKEEGGYTANDEGNPANFGINQGANPDLDVAHITREQAIERYRTGYWIASGADRLDWPFCLFVMNAAVQAGDGVARQLLSESGGNMLRFQGLFQIYYSQINQDRWNRNSKAWMARCGLVLMEAGKLA